MLENFEEKEVWKTVFFIHVFPQAVRLYFFPQAMLCGY